MTRAYLSADQIQTIRHALIVAAERFEEHSKELKIGSYGSVGGFPAWGDPHERGREIKRLSAQFDKQAQEARDLAETIDGASAIALETEPEEIEQPERHTVFNCKECGTPMCQLSYSRP